MNIWLASGFMWGFWLGEWGREGLIFIFLEAVSDHFYTGHFSMILCIYFWLCGVFVAAQAFLWLQRVGFSLQWLLWLQSTRSRHLGSVAVASWLSSPGSVVVAHGLSCFTACGVLLDQESNLCLLHWHVDSSPPSQQGSPIRVLWATSALFRLSFLLNKYPGVGFLDHRVCVCVCVCVC